jgi:hypothetical protein
VDLVHSGSGTERCSRLESAPKKQNHAPLVAAIRMSQPAWTDRLATVLRGEVNEAKPAAPEAASAAPATAPVSAPVSVQVSAPVAAPDAGVGVELGVLRLADELDLPARAVRRPLGRLLERFTSAGLDLVGVQTHIQSWIADGG